MQREVARLTEEIGVYAQQPDATPEAFKRQYLGKKGALARLFASLKEVAPVERKALGSSLNKLKQAAEAVHTTLLERKGDKSFTALPAEDFTLPPTAPLPGSLHPLRLVEQRAVSILTAIGFEVVEGPEVEDDWHNFSALNFPEHHPARDMQDTFFLAEGGGMALRPHTSSVQVRLLEERNPPLRALAYGRVYRNETVSARSHCMFHQIEVMCVDKGLSFLDFKETLQYFVRGLFGGKVSTRLRPSYFPFTEPSVEVDVACPLCYGNKCSICKYSGWVEIGGAGMVDPNVLERCKVDPEVYTGYAWGMGIERIAMLLYRIDDVRLFTENNCSFLAQFHP